MDSGYNRPDDRAYDRPNACARCGSDRLVRIVYGLIRDPEAHAAAARGEFVLGGCCVGPELWHCQACGVNQGRRPRHPPDTLLGRLERWAHSRR